VKINKILTLAALMFTAVTSVAQTNIVEQVAWVVGDQPIWKSEIEAQYNNMQNENINIKGDPYCVIPEQLAIEKLYLHQADVDTIEAPNGQVVNEVEQRINFYINQFGSKEKMEEYFRKTMPEIREFLTEIVRNGYRVRNVQQNLTKNIKVTPSDVRKYYDALPPDSIPFVPMQVEAEIMTLYPVIPRQEVEDVKARLRDFSESVAKGEKEFSTLAILYSEDKASAVRGGEIGFMGRGQLDPEYAAVAFNLNDSKRVSKIVESEYGFHIIQLIEKRGDRINTRHILLRPRVSDASLQEALNRLDTVRADVVDRKKITFEEVIPLVSQDKDTRNNRGLMVNPQTGTSRFEMSELPQEVAKAVNDMQVGDISKPFVMMDPKHNREVVAMVKLVNRIDGHKANMADDYQTVKNMYENARRAELLEQWLEKKIADTYVRIEDGWRNCDFQHKGWIKEAKK
jgi:peptidyl-prolyl cis-trans isomerase SurA